MDVSNRSLVASNLLVAMYKTSIEGTSNESLPTTGESIHSVQSGPSITHLKDVTAGIIIPIFYSILFLLGSVGNSTVIYFTFVKNGVTENPIDIFIGNLAVADLVLTLTVPFWCLTHILKGDWIFGDFGCKVMSFLLHVNMFSSVFIITAMAINRYRAVVTVRRRDNMNKKIRTIRYCGFIWMFSCVFSIPTLVLRKTVPRRDEVRCSWKYPNNTATFWWVEHTVARNLVAFAIPLMIILYCYWNIVLRVKRQSFKSKAIRSSSHKRMRNVTRTVTKFVVAFVICWLPNQLSNFLHSLWYFGILPRPVSEYDQELAYLAHIFTTILCFSSSIVNPLIYSVIRHNKSQIKVLLRNMTTCFVTSNTQ